MTNIKWTLEKLQKEALEYKTRGEFKKNSKSAYSCAVKRKLLDQICNHMPKHIDQSGFNSHRLIWTIEMLQEEALKYKTRGEFQRNSPNAYSSARKRNFLDKICSHMPKHIFHSNTLHPKFKWTSENLQEEALKYKNRSDFQINNASAYRIAIKKGIIDKICSHMKLSANVSKNEYYILNIIKQKYVNAKNLKKRKIKVNNKPYIKGFDIDIYIPELNKGIEFDGTYWHSAKGLKKSRKHWPEEDILNYSRIKDDYFKSIGIEILHIKEKDWLIDKEKEIKKCFDFLGNYNV